MSTAGIGCKPMKPRSWAKAMRHDTERSQTKSHSIRRWIKMEAEVLAATFVAISSHGLLCTDGFGPLRPGPVVPRPNGWDRLSPPRRRRAYRNRFLAVRGARDRALYRAGKIDQWSVKQDQSGCRVIMNVPITKEAHELLGQVPLGRLAHGISSVSARSIRPPSSVLTDPPSNSLTPHPKPHNRNIRCPTPKNPRVHDEICPRFRRSGSDNQDPGDRFGDAKERRGIARLAIRGARPGRNNLAGKMRVVLQTEVYGVSSS